MLKLVYNSINGGDYMNFKKKVLIALMTLVIGINLLLVAPNSTAASAGLAWGPKIVGNLKFYLTNVHVGWAGPKFPWASHTNFHVDKKSSGGYKSVANYHIVKYQKVGNYCIYIYDSVKKQVVMDSCGDSWTNIANKAASAMKSFIKTVLDNADWLATVSVWSLITLAIVDIIVPGDPIPIIPFSEQPIARSTQPTIESQSTADIYSEDVYITETQPVLTKEQLNLYDINDLSHEEVNDAQGNVSTYTLPVLPLSYLTKEKLDSITLDSSGF